MNASPVVVGLDGIAGSGQALAWGLRQARQAGAALRVVHVWRWGPPPTRTPGSTAACDWSDGGEAQVRRGLHRLVAQVLGVDAGDALADLRLVESGHVGEALVGTAADAGLLVIGRNRGRGPGSVPGATGRYVTRYAPCPVVVVPTSQLRDGSTVRIPDLLQTDR